MLRKRLFAFFIDGFIIFSVLEIVKFLDEVILPPSTVVDILLMSICFIITFGYWPIQLTMFRRTVGMKMMKIEIIKNNGDKPKLWGIIVRTCFGILDFGPIRVLLIFYKNQSLGDIVSGTKIVDAKDDIQNAFNPK